MGNPHNTWILRWGVIKQQIYLWVVRNVFIRFVNGNDSVLDIFKENNFLHKAYKFLIRTISV